MKILLLIVFLLVPLACFANGTQYQIGYYATTGAALTGNSAIITDASNNLLVSTAVAIGTTVPQKPLHVRHSSNGPISIDRSVNTIYSGVNFVDNGASNERWFIGMIPNADTFVIHNRSIAGVPIVVIEDQGQINSLYIKANGDVGIGTSSPGYNLHVIGDIFASGSISCGGSCGGGGSSQWTTSGSDIYYSAGNVGIGVTAPGQILQLGDSARSSNTYIRFQNLAIGGPGLDVGVRVSDGSGLMWENDARDLVFGTTNTERMRVRHTGEVGIGTTFPAYALDVRSGQVAGAGAFVNTSDARQKKDIKPLSHGLADVLKLRPVTFNWKDQTQDWQKHHEIGLIAQDLESVVPEVVYTEPRGERLKAVAYGALVPVLIKAVQELKAEDDQLRSDFEAYKKSHP